MPVKRIAAIRPAVFLITFLTLSSFIWLQPKKTVLYIIGDSTVKNGSSTGGGGCGAGAIL